MGDSDFRVAVARLNPNGSLDTTFSGDGKLVFSWGAISRATAVVVLPNGKILVGGFSGPEGGNMQVARLTATGALDGTFGTGGKAAVDFGGDDFGAAIARQANGRILIAGRSTTAGAVVARLRANGVLDPIGGGDGRVTVGGGSLSAVLVQPDRKIIVAGNAGSSAMMTVTRMRTTGAPDTTFDGDGTATIDFGSLADVGNDGALQGDGKIVVAGFTSSPSRARRSRGSTPNGSPDATFGAAGKTTVDFGVVTFANAVALQPNGRIVIAGTMTGVDDFALARLLG